jgi:tetratricopeptide (TPR) repeat protein
MRLLRLFAAAALAASALAFSGGSGTVAAAPSNSARTALVIANGAYADGDAELTTPAGDADKLAEALKGLGFRTKVEKDLRKQPMEDSIETYLSHVEPGSVAVVFFAGYGVQAGGKNYLIPIDPRIWSEADLAKEAVSVEELQTKLARKDVKARILILEAARRNPFERRFRSVSAGLAPSAAAPGLIRFYSAVNAILPDAPGAKNSVFVAELAKALTSDRHATQAFEAARDEIARQTKTQPFLTSGLTEPLWLDAARKTADSGASPPPPPPPPPPSPPPPPEKPKAEPKPEPKVVVRPEPKPEPKTEPKAPPAKVDPKAEAGPEAPPPVKPYTPSENARRAELDTRIARDPADETSLAERGLLLAQHRDYALALADFEASTRLNPGNVQSWNNRCWIRAILNQLPKALDDCSEALKRKPKFADALDSRGLVRLKLGDAEAAKADYSAALRINPMHASALYGRGKARLRLGDADGADDDMSRARNLNPSIEAEYREYGLK